jgi:hypothetical protein
VFLSFDIIALIVQAVGGASASGAAESHHSAVMARFLGLISLCATNFEQGGNIMLGGIAFQMVGITIYVALASEFFWRYFTRRPIRTVGAAPSDHTLAFKESPSDEKPTLDLGMALSRRLKLMIFGLLFSTLVIFIRSVYRTIELADGWNGRIIGTQVYFSQPFPSSTYDVVADDLSRRLGRCNDCASDVHAQHLPSWRPLARGMILCARTPIIHWNRFVVGSGRFLDMNRGQFSYYIFSE